LFGICEAEFIVFIEDFQLEVSMQIEAGEFYEPFANGDVH
jgi:hypothetical protein